MSTVYVLRCGDENLFKFGWTRGDVATRIRSLATGNPKLKLFAVIESEDAKLCENYLLWKFRKRRVPGDAKEWFALEPGEITNAIDEAREFVNDFAPKRQEAERLSAVENDDVILKPSPSDWETYKSLVDVRVAETATTLARTRLETNLKLVIGHSGGLDGIATWKMQTIREFDEASFKEAEPALHRAYVRDLRRRVFRLR
jgi:Meiotically Up-regulated Gene 113 (MUG113) protein